MASKATEVCEKDACELSFPLHRVIASISTPGGTEKDNLNAAAWSELFCLPCCRGLRGSFWLRLLVRPRLRIV